MDLKLSVELVPRTLWRRSLSERLKDSVWQEIRRPILDRAAGQCEVCGAVPSDGRLLVHEIWKYDDAAAVQRLSGLKAVCNMCSLVMHYGRAGVMAREGKVNLDEVFTHLYQVNGIDADMARRHVRDAFEIWTRRSMLTWRQHFGEYEAVVADPANLKGGPRRVKSARLP